MLKCYYYFQTKVCCTLHHTPGNLSHSLKYPSFQHKHNISHDNYDQAKFEVARQPLPTIALHLCVCWCVLVQCDGAIVWNFSLCLPNTQIPWSTFSAADKNTIITRNWQHKTDSHTHLTAHTNQWGAALFIWNPDPCCSMYAETVVCLWYCKSNTGSCLYSHILAAFRRTSIFFFKIQIKR